MGNRFAPEHVLLTPLENRFAFGTCSRSQKNCFSLFFFGIVFSARAPAAGGESVGRRHVYRNPDEQSDGTRHTTLEIQKKYRSPRRLYIWGFVNFVAGRCFRELSFF